MRETRRRQRSSTLAAQASRLLCRTARLSVWLSAVPAWVLLTLVTAHPAAAGARLPVAVSVPPQVWLVEEVGGDRVEVFELVRAGDSPATYQPSDAQVTRLLRSKVYFRIGVPFENGRWFEAIRGSRRVRIVDLREGVELRPMDGHAGHAAGGQDPHIWLSPSLLAIQARTVGRTLAEVDPEHAPQYRANLARLEAELEALDRELRQTLATLAGKSFFVFHPAWGYFAGAYGLREVAIETAGKEPSDRELTALQRQARQAGAGVVFVQPQISGRTAGAVARAIGGRLETLDPLARDVPENLRRTAELLRRCFDP